MRLVALFGSLLPFVSGGSYDAAPLSSGGGGAPLFNANASAWTVTAGGAGAATFVVRAPLPTAPPSRPADAPSNVTYPFSTLAEKPNDPTRDLSWSILGLPPQECCDDLDCGNPLLPHWPGNCAEKIQCGAPCPEEPIDAYTPLIKNAFGNVDTCKNRAPPGQICVCNCKCVCKYPSGRILWVFA